MQPADFYPCYWIVFYEKSLLLVQQGDSYTLPYTEVPPTPVSLTTTIHNIGQWNELPVKAYTVSTMTVENEDFFSEWVDLRESYELLPIEAYRWAGKAAQILHWDKNSQFCPHCGIPTISISPIGKKCLRCSQEWYPHLAPAIIVLIQKEEEILLVRSRNFKRNYMGLVAGFLEPGESLEECVIREVKEETGLEIEDLKYFGSQSWPYPSGIMIGYTARYKSGELTLQKEELEAGGFFSRENLPPIPQKLSIARKLIDAWIDGTLTK